MRAARIAINRWCAITTIEAAHRENSDTLEPSEGALICLAARANYYR